MSDQAEKLLPLRRLEAPVHKFIKVAIPTDLERLQKHQMNIEKYQRCKQWDRLHQEHINASRTVQQLQANLREMETLCGRVRRVDAGALEKLVQPIKERASKATHDFLKLHANTANVQPPAPPTNSEEALGGGPAAQGHVCGVEEDEGPGPAQLQLQLPEIPQDQNAAESWESLEEDLLELNGLVNEFSELAHSQQDKIDSIEDHVSAAAANVEEGSRSLGKAVKYKMAVLPVACALLGGVVGGPLGLLAGFKVASVAAAVGGGVLGFAGGNLIQKSRRAKVDLQLQGLSGSRQEAGCKDE